MRKCECGYITNEGNLICEDCGETLPPEYETRYIQHLGGGFSEIEVEKTPNNDGYDISEHKKREIEDTIYGYLPEWRQKEIKKSKSPFKKIKRKYDSAYEKLSVIYNG